jgi:hypothetical protein
VNPVPQLVALVQMQWPAEHMLPVEQSPSTVHDEVHSSDTLSH